MAPAGVLPGCCMSMFGCWKLGLEIAAMAFHLAGFTVDFMQCLLGMQMTHMNDVSNEMLGVNK